MNDLQIFNSEEEVREMLKKNKKHNERISPSEKIIRCVKCKNKILKTDKYCQYCGHATKTKIF